MSLRAQAGPEGFEVIALVQPATASPPREGQFLMLTHPFHRITLVAMATKSSGCRERGRLCLPSAPPLPATPVIDGVCGEVKECQAKGLGGSGGN